MEIQQLIQTSFKNLYATENVVKKLAIIQQVNTKTEEIINNVVQDLGAVKTDLKEYSNYLLSLSTKLDNIEKINNNTDIIEISYNELKEKFDKISEKFDKDKESLIDLFEKDTEGNKNQINALTESVKEIGTTIDNYSPQNQLENLTKTLDLSYSELRVIKDEREKHFTSFKEALDRLNEISESFKAEIKSFHDSETNKTEQFSKLLERVEKIDSSVSKLRPSDDTLSVDQDLNSLLDSLSTRQEMPLGHVIFADEVTNTTDEEIENIVDKSEANLQNVLKSIGERHEELLAEERAKEEAEEDVEVSNNEDYIEEEYIEEEHKDNHEEKQGFLKKWFL